MSSKRDNSDSGDKIAPDNLSEEKATPDNWSSIVNDDCDLDLAFDALGSYKHFHTDTLRGRTRSLQLRYPEAKVYFLRAQSKFHEWRKKDNEAHPSPHKRPRRISNQPFELNGKTTEEILADKLRIKNYVRFLFLKVYIFENELIRVGDEEQIARLGILKDEIIEFAKLIPFSDEYSSLVSQRRIHILALNHSYLREYAKAGNLFKSLIDKNYTSNDVYSSSQLNDAMTGFFIGAAASLREANDEDAEVFMSHAISSMRNLNHNLNKGIYAGMLFALLRIWGRRGEAGEWRAYIRKLNVPEKTRSLFIERAKLILDRTDQLERVVLF